MQLSVKMLQCGTPRLISWSAHINKLDQAARATYLLILGLPTASSNHASALPEIVFKEIILPCLEAVGAKGEISAQLATIPHPTCHLQRVPAAC